MFLGFNHMQKYYLTTAIDYINATPHVGHALEKIGADVLARWKRMNGCEVHFLTGTDEHSLNIQRQAEKQGVTPHEFCNSMVENWKQTWTQLGISYDQFIRTTDPQHERAVAVLFQKLYDAGHLYLNDYEGLYCPSCENFYTEKDAPDFQCPTHKRALEVVKEKNYYFRLTAFESQLRQLITSGEFAIEPVPRRNEILGLLDEGLRDVTFTRASVKWGVSCPIAKEQTIWIWFDALVNYISAIGFPNDPARFEKLWPADVHIIGKDITRFHCVIWPAMLLGAGLPLPKKVFAHGFITVNGEKLSKTVGNVIDPNEAIAKHGVDALRYFLLREVPFDGDGDFSWTKFEQRYNSELANDLGNFVNRAVSMIHRYREGKVPQPTADSPLTSEIRTLTEETRKIFASKMDAILFHEALATLWKFVQFCNAYVESNAPWALAKKPEQSADLSTVLYNLAEAARVIAVMLEPFMPQSSAKIFSQLGLPENRDGFGGAAWGKLAPGTLLAKPTPLFPKAV